ncbi:MAG: hypothetical protein O3A63_16435 [Proteobacteria bacterium]|nr:hypothetical protein [Pseudomonadota bacterium]
MTRWLAAVCALVFVIACANVFAEPVDGHKGVIELDETVISGNQELPKVLYILPWRQPSGLPDIDLDEGFSEIDVFKRLYPPAYRRELDYFETFEGTQKSKE